MSSFVTDIKAKYKNGSWAIRLIILNVIAFLLAFVVMLIARAVSGSDDFMNNFYFPLSFKTLLFQPWSIFTYMFLHSFNDIFHILYNMMFLYWFGDMASRLMGNRSVLANYIMGGISAAFIFSLVGHLFPIMNEDAILVGASGAVYAIVFSVVFYNPNQKINLLFIGPVAIKYLAMFMVFVDILKISQGENTGGQFSHFGGLLWAFIFVVGLKKGKNLNAGVDKVIDFLSSLVDKKKTFKVVHTKPVSDDVYNSNKQSQQKRVDAILDKISKSGYESLSKQEKDFLFKASNR